MRKTGVAMAVAVGVTLTACGGSDDEPAGASPEPAATTTVAVESENEEAAGGDDASAPAEEPAADEIGPDSEWCAAAREVEELDAVLSADDFDFTDAGAVESAVTAFTDAVGRARDVAPAEIADDVETTFDGFTRLTQSLADVEWSFLDADLSVIDDTSVSDAGDRIEAYNAEVCGIPVDDDDEDADDMESDDENAFDPNAGTAREQIAAGLIELGFTDDEAACIVDNIDPSAYTDDDNTSQVIEAFEVCDIPLDRLMAVGDG